MVYKKELTHELVHAIRFFEIIGGNSLSGKELLKYLLGKVMLYIEIDIFTISDSSEDIDEKIHEIVIGVTDDIFYNGFEYNDYFINRNIDTEEDKNESMVNDAEIQILEELNDMIYFLVYFCLENEIYNVDASAIFAKGKYLYLITKD